MTLVRYGVSQLPPEAMYGLSRLQISTKIYLVYFNHSIIPFWTFCAEAALIALKYGPIVLC